MAPEAYGLTAASRASVRRLRLGRNKALHSHAGRPVALIHDQGSQTEAGRTFSTHGDYTKDEMARQASDDKMYGAEDTSSASTRTSAVAPGQVLK